MRRRPDLALRNMARATHKQSRTPTYRSWQAMKKRCATPTDSSYTRYGGRGITVCAAWAESFERFLGDMGPRPSLRHSIERIDNEGHYEPGNCRWATAKEQAHNKRTSHFLTFNGESKTVMAWAEATGINWQTLFARLRRGWSTEQALTQPLHTNGRWRDLP